MTAAIAPHRDGDLDGLAALLADGIAGSITRRDCSFFYKELTE